MREEEEEEEDGLVSYDFYFLSFGEDPIGHIPSNSNHHYLLVFFHVVGGLS